MNNTQTTTEICETQDGCAAPAGNDAKEQRWIYKNGEVCGPFTLAELSRMAGEGGINHSTLFFSELQQNWVELVAIREDYRPTSEKLKQFVASGVRKVIFLAAGGPGECDVCAALDCKKFPIAAAPQMPPSGCRCQPWCKSLLGASE